MSDLASLTLSELMDRFGDATPTPGGGSAAALAGALASSLARMVAAVTANRTKTEGLAPQMRQLEQMGGELARRLTAAIQEDSDAYNLVTAAYRLPKETDEEKKTRSIEVQAALKAAADAPLGTAAACLQAAELSLELLERGLASAGSDAAVAIHLALAGVEGSALNVATNLDSIKDAAYVGETKEEMQDILARAADIRANAVRLLRSRIRSLPDAW